MYRTVWFDPFNRRDVRAIVKTHDTQEAARADMEREDPPAVYCNLWNESEDSPRIVASREIRPNGRSYYWP